MALIGILSDTHSYLNDYVYQYFNDCEEIWHAGDFGSYEVYEKLLNFKPLRAVYGNIDGTPLKKLLPEINTFEYQGLRVMIKHIVGYPGKYDKTVKDLLSKNSYDLVIAGHSHILRIMYDKLNHFLFINPGAAGLYGIQQKITLVKINISDGLIKEANIWEKER